jgi:cytochrome c oxidase cbb3-type subunit I/II
MKDPQLTSPGSIMPAYTWMLDNDLNTAALAAKITAMRTLGVPYPENYEAVALRDLQTQAKEIQADLLASDIQVDDDKEIIAMIAYLQRLGTDVKLDTAMQNLNKRYTFE